MEYNNTNYRPRSNIQIRNLLPKLKQYPESMIQLQQMAQFMYLGSGYILGSIIDASST